MLSKCLVGAVMQGAWFGLGQARGFPCSYGQCFQKQPRLGLRQKAGRLCPAPEQKIKSNLWKESKAQVGEPGAAWGHSPSGGETVHGRSRLISCGPGAWKGIRPGGKSVSR